MTDQLVTAVEAWRHRHRWRRRLGLIVLLLLLALAVLVLIVGGFALRRFTDNGPVAYASIEEHFKYGSIGSEPESGIPYWIWKVLPSLYPEEFGHRQDYSALGFLYEQDASGRQRDLPIGVSQRRVQGIDVVWLNCATCHAGTWRTSPDQPARIVLGMPSNNLDFYGFIRMILRAATDERLAPDELFPRMESAGAQFNMLDRLIWRAAVLPRVREGLVRNRGRLQPLLDGQPAWGPGRVDTFNPYKVLQFGLRADCRPGEVGSCLTRDELIGVADLPAIFDQHPRANMNLHWDGNNASLQERNLSAAIGTGVTARTVDHSAIGRIASWLDMLKPPASPHRPDPAAVERGRTVYREACASCHGWQGNGEYVFKGERLGQVEPITAIGTDPSRLDSYTEAFRQRQLNEMFAGTEYQFRHFKKTNGYANLPLDGLWLRGPYLHNGSVPTLADLLKPPDQRPKTFVRGLDVIDPANGGFQSPPCTPSAPLPKGFCFDTALRGNGSGGHVYGVERSAADKSDLLAYLLTF